MDVTEQMAVSPSQIFTVMFELSTGGFGVGFGEIAVIVITGLGLTFTLTVA